MRKLYLFILAIAGVFTLSACSTMINTTTQEIELKSNPPNAKITVDGKKFGTSPQVVNIDRSSDHVVKFELDGYEPYETQLTRKMSWWFWGNALNGFIPGMTIDYFTGSMYNLLPEQVATELTPAKVELPAKKR
ncbi:MAG: PEGA domain-containing protein [Ignavibacteria bacterium]|nr:PEGA domain-containing protein [Ignavibacteria bacterium]